MNDGNTMRSATFVVRRRFGSMAQTLVEGKARLELVTERVFYNPVQEFNRDLSVLALRVFVSERKGGETRGVDVLEALSATGLRSIRYAKEVAGIERIVANDISKTAVESIKANAESNGVDHLVEARNEDAAMIMYSNRQWSQRFAVVDLDPYGCPSTFLDGAVQCVADDGMLLVTATDMAILAGNTPETCYCKYGAISLKTPACHEQGLRILLQCIESHANRYGRYIVPVLSVSADFYIRVFVKIFTGPVHCKKTVSKLSMVYQCVGCGTLSLQPLGSFKPNPSENDPHRVKASIPHSPPVNTNCDHCSNKFQMGGPIWSGPLHELSFVEKMLKIVQVEPHNFGTCKRIEGTLCMVLEELNDVPLYYTTHKLSGKLHISTIPILTIRSAIMNGGYRVSYSHACKSSIKTDAPASYVWDILRTWEKRHPVKKERLYEGSVAASLLGKEITSTIDLTDRNDANPISRKNGYLRFQDNPLPYWGPGTKSTAHLKEEKIAKSRRNQNKKSINKSNNRVKREISPSEEENKKMKTEFDNL